MPPNVKRPREGPSTVPSSVPSSSGGKRVKFAPDDILLGESAASARPAPGGGDDELEGDLLEGGAGKKSKEVVTDGYDSDSSAGSEGGFGIGGGRKGKVGAAGKDGGAEGEDDDDMFGGEEEDGKANGESKGKGKSKEFLEMGDIEGQEFGKGEDGEDGAEAEEEDEEDYLPDDDLANDDDAPRSRRSKASMGYTLSSFNMADELAEGRFSADGSYVANSTDPLATHDVWLAGVSKSAIKAARASQLRMEEDQRRRDEREAKGEGALAQERDDCLIGLLGIVREGETVARALARLGAAKKKVVRPVKPRGVHAAVKAVGESADAMEVDDEASHQNSSATTVAAGTSVPEQVEDPVAQKIDLVTHLASTLLSTHGELEIYDQTYEDIIATLKKEGAVRRDWVPARDPDLAREEHDAAVARDEAARDAAGGAVRIGNRTRPLIARPVAATGAASSPSSAATSFTSKYWYKWNTPPAGQSVDQEYGPFGRAELDGWVAGGYFGAGGTGVSVRVEGKEGWVSWQEATG